MKKSFLLSFYLFGVCGATASNALPDNIPELASNEGSFVIDTTVNPYERCGVNGVSCNDTALVNYSKTEADYRAYGERTRRDHLYTQSATGNNLTATTQPGIEDDVVEDITIANSVLENSNNQITGDGIFSQTGRLDLESDPTQYELDPVAVQKRNIDERKGIHVPTGVVYTDFQPFDSTAPDSVSVDVDTKTRKITNTTTTTTTTTTEGDVVCYETGYCYHVDQNTGARVLADTSYSPNTDNAKLIFNSNGSGSRVGVASSNYGEKVIADGNLGGIAAAGTISVSDKPSIVTSNTNTYKIAMANTPAKKAYESKEIKEIKTITSSTDSKVNNNTHPDVASRYKVVETIVEENTTVEPGATLNMDRVPSIEPSASVAKNTSDVKNIVNKLSNGPETKTITTLTDKVVIETTTTEPQNEIGRVDILKDIKESQKTKTVTQEQKTIIATAEDGSTYEVICEEDCEDFIENEKFDDVIESEFTEESFDIADYIEEDNEEIEFQNVGEPIKVVEDINIKDIKIGENTVLTWEAQEGENLRDLLIKWSEMAGWKLLWNTNRNYTLSASVMFKGKFADVSSALIRAFARARPAPIATYYKGNRVIVIETMENENAY